MDPFGLLCPLCLCHQLCLYYQFARLYLLCLYYQFGLLCLFGLFGPFGLLCLLRLLCRLNQLVLGIRWDPFGRFGRWRLFGPFGPLRP